MTGGLKLVKRTKSKVIRSVRYHREKDPENFVREQLMLYMPWRNEMKDLMDSSEPFAVKYKKVKEIIDVNSKPCEKNTHSFEALETVATADLANDYSSVAPNSQHSHEQDYAVGTQESKLYGCFDPRPNSCRHYDLIDESGVYPRTEMDVSVQVNEMTDADFRKRVQSVNKEQMEFFYHVLHSIKSNSQPLKLFLSGGARVGKSWVLNILFEAITRHFNHLPGEDPDELKVMKVVPTGKAAFNIGGNTLHSAFQIPANQGFQYTVLDSDRLYTMRNTYRKLKVLFIDDISMVGSGLFNFLNQRLQHIMGSKIAFGGINVIAVGDLFQLQPVFDKWVFENSSSEYSDLARNT